MNWIKNPEIYPRLTRYGIAYRESNDVLCYCPDFLKEHPYIIGWVVYNSDIHEYSWRFSEDVGDVIVEAWTYITPPEETDVDSPRA